MRMGLFCGVSTPGGYLEEAAKQLVGSVPVGTYTFLGWDRFFEKIRVCPQKHVLD
jgi:hypothetical protein